MSTALDLINRSMRIIGVLAEGEALSNQGANDALTAFNQMLDSWSNESLTIFSKVEEIFPLVAGQQTYTMGSGANFNTTRPQLIENCYLQYLNDTPIVELPIRILNKDEWASIIVKTIESDIPIYMYPDYAYPNVNINLWPEPDTANNVVLWSWKPLSDFATLTTSVSLPPGYEAAIVYNGAAWLAPEYGKVLRPDVASLAVTTKASIKRMNAKPLYLRVDNALLPRAGAFNWRTGGSGNR